MFVCVFVWFFFFFHCIYAIIIIVIIIMSLSSTKSSFHHQGFSGSGSAEEPSPLELVTCSGHMKNGSLFVLHESVRCVCVCVCVCV